MEPCWMGLWAAGYLTRTQWRALSACEGDAEGAVRAMWADEGRRPRKWKAFESVDALLAGAATAYQRLLHAQQAASQEFRIVVADELGVRGRSPYLCCCGPLPPSRGALAVVGTRRITQQDAEDITRWLRPLVSQTRAVISGGAHGVDTQAHRIAVERGVPTWVVFASGFDHISPKPNVALFHACLDVGGGWVSEKPPWYSPFANDFLERNEVISALSNAVLVARAPARSGALSTARSAMAQQKPVLAFPGMPDDPNAVGCHALLQRGAIWARPDMNLAPWLGDEQGLVFETTRSLHGISSRTFQAGERLDLPAPSVHLDEEEAVMIRMLSVWKQEGSQGWILGNAARHQEILLDLELSGWIGRDDAGMPAWTERGEIAEKLAREGAKEPPA